MCIALVRFLNRQSCSFPGILLRGPRLWLRLLLDVACGRVLPLTPSRPQHSGSAAQNEAN